MADSEQNLQEPINPSQITMKIDAPSEDSTSTKEENEDNDRNESVEAKGEEAFKMPLPKPPSPAKSPLPIAVNRFVTRGILKPPQLSLNNDSGNSSSSPKPFVLNPSRLNPFAKVSGADDKNDDKKSSQVNGETPKFMPLVCENKSAPSSNNQTSTSASAAPPAAVAVAAAALSPTPTTNVSSSSNTFVFGQNLLDRVRTSENQSDEPKPSTSLNSNGTTGLLFSNAIKNEAKCDGSLQQSKEAKSLSESAREYEESRASKRKYEEVEVKTGEEGENNILNTSCKLFAFDKASGTWQERGRGVLRLNDLEVDENYVQSRLVFRTTGSLRVVLNTKIWAEMTVEQASEKSTRFTAQDASGEIKVFLVMAGIEDSKQLFSQIQTRVQKEIASQKLKKLHTSSDLGDN